MQKPETVDLTERLAAMFEDSPRNADRHLPMYHYDAQLGTKPWWEPLCVVWAAQGVPPRGSEECPYWAEAWGLLRGLHEHYLVSKGINHD